MTRVTPSGLSNGVKDRHPVLRSVKHAIDMIGLVADGNFAGAVNAHTAYMLSSAVSIAGNDWLADVSGFDKLLDILDEKGNQNGRLAGAASKEILMVMLPAALARPAVTGNAPARFVTDRAPGPAATAFNPARYTDDLYRTSRPLEYPVFVSRELSQSATMAQMLEGRLLPGDVGVRITDRTIHFDSLWRLSEMHGIEWALTRELDAAGSTVFRLYSGGPRWVHKPSNYIRQIAHTHPSGNAAPSWSDIANHNAAWLRYIDSLPAGTPVPQPWMQRIIHGPGPYQLEAGGHISNTTRIFPFDGR